MTHAATRGGGAAGDETGSGFTAALFGLVLQELGGFFLGIAADLADHDDRMGVGIAQEPFQHVDMLGPFDRVAADADASGLAQAYVRGLLDRLVGQGAGTGHDADAASLVNVAGHDADLALVGRDHAGAVGADQAGFRALKRALDLHHVQDRDALGDAHHQRNLRVDRL